MTVFSRAASFAAMFCCMIGLVAHSTPGLAADVSVLPVPVAPVPAVVLNVPAPASVPQPPVSQPSTQTLADDTIAPGDTVAYPTLAAAVAAQKMPSDADEELECLAAATYYESKGEPLAGQLAVAQVILNRADAGRFGSDVCAVVKQPGQFSFVRGGRIPAVDASRPAYKTAMAVAKVAMADAWESDAGKALYFHARRVSPGWNRTRVTSIGNHVFYR